VCVCESYALCFRFRFVELHLFTRFKEILPAQTNKQQSAAAAAAQKQQQYHPRSVPGRQSGYRSPHRVSQVSFRFLPYHPLLFLPTWRGCVRPTDKS